MGVVNVTRKWSQKDVQHARDKKSVTLGYTLLLSSPSDNIWDYMDVEALPSYGDPLDGDTWKRCVSKGAKAVSPLLYDISVTFESIGGSGSANGDEDNPLKRRPQVRWGHATEQVEIDTDPETEEPITNSAGESYDPPLTTEVSDLVLTYVRNESWFEPGVAQSYKDHINSDPFLGFEAETVKCVEYGGEFTVEGDFEFYVVTRVFHIRLDGWRKRVLDRGFHEKIGETDNNIPILRKFVDDEGNPLTEPQLLNGQGRRLNSLGDPIWRRHYVNKKRAFAPMGIVLP